MNDDTEINEIPDNVVNLNDWKQNRPSLEKFVAGLERRLNEDERGKLEEVLDYSSDLQAQIEEGRDQREVEEELVKYSKTIGDRLKGIVFATYALSMAEISLFHEGVEDDKQKQKRAQEISKRLNVLDSST